MKVETLINLLKKLDPKSPVYITQAGFGHDKIQSIRTERIFTKERDSVILYLQSGVVTYDGQKVIYRKTKTKAELIKEK